MEKGKTFSDRFKNVIFDVAEILIAAISQMDQKRVDVGRSVIWLSETATRLSTVIL